MELSGKQRKPSVYGGWLGFAGPTMYARGMTVREIQGFLAEMYSVDVSPDLISRVTDAVMSEVTAWQTRPLEAMFIYRHVPATTTEGINEGLL